jgi:hypothetical protein
MAPTLHECSVGAQAIFDWCRPSPSSLRPESRFHQRKSYAKLVRSAKNLLDLGMIGVGRGDRSPSTVSAGVVLEVQEGSISSGPARSFGLRMEIARLIRRSPLFARNQDVRPILGNVAFSRGIDRREADFLVAPVVEQMRVSIGGSVLVDRVEILLAGRPLVPIVVSTISLLKHQGFARSRLSLP